MRTGANVRPCQVARRQHKVEVFVVVHIEEVSVEDGSMPLTAGHALKQHAYGGLTHPEEASPPLPDR